MPCGRWAKPVLGPPVALHDRSSRRPIRRAALADAPRACL